MPTKAAGPTLLVFAPCERVIIGGEGDGTASLISILQGFKVGASGAIPEEFPEGENPTFPAPWYFFALWDQGGQTAETYEQKFELHSAKDKVLISVPSSWTFEKSKRFH